MENPIRTLHGGRERYGLVFCLAVGVTMIVLLPLMLYDRGYFLYYGDFVSQQLPFYSHANDIVRSGGLFGWDWYTDLGSSFLGSYAFYLTGSPFFWLSVLLPRAWVLYAIPWLLGLKHGVAAVTAYGYIRRFVRSPSAAAIGGLLYAFSGFQLFNIFFNHFQDVTAFFPLMLISMEELVNRNRRGWFAACVALMAVINYFFFAGQVTFLVLYFFMRVNCRDFRVDLKKLLALGIEAVLGVMLACVVLLPAALAVMHNNRVDQALYGMDAIFYSDKTRILRIIQSFFMLPDPPARPVLFDTEQARWASIGGYLPLFSMAGVITFMGQKKRHWATKLVLVCILCAFVPILNCAFYLFNSSYYARWYYMPLLIMAMMTAQALDDRSLDWKRGVTVSGVMLLVFGAIALIPIVNEEEAVEYFHFAKIPQYFCVELGICALCWAGLFYLWRKRRRIRNDLHAALVLTTAACVLCMGSMVYFGKTLAPDREEYIDCGINGRDRLSVSYDTDAADYFRVDISEDFDNYPMFWGLSSMRCFQSVVSPSILDFYESIGITRDVASRAEPSAYTLRGLFSVKYYFDRDDGGEDLQIPGFVYRDTENGFKVYENEAFVPMGFSYDRYVTAAALDGKTDATKERILIQALVLDEEQAARYSDRLTDLSASASLSLTEEQYLAACREHAAEACRDFCYDASGFSGRITLPAPKLVFFSIPYDTGWSAQVNGEAVPVERVSGGLMAVPCEAGENAITFRYTLPGLRTGALVSGAGLILLVLYLLVSASLFTGGTHSHSYDYAPLGGVRAARAYTRYLESASPHTGTKGERPDGTSEGNTPSQ